VNLTTLLKYAFDYEHWVDPCLQIRAVKELGLEHFWPISSEVRLQATGYRLQAADCRFGASPNDAAVDQKYSRLR
jgi:hypothetical protein